MTFLSITQKLKQGLVQLDHIRVTFNKTINFITFTYKSTHHHTNKKNHNLGLDALVMVLHNIF